jgi:hypothetical protein
LSEAIKNDIKEANNSSQTIENVGLKNGGEITIKQCFKLSKRELSEAIENDIKEANESSQTLTELSEHFAECKLWVQDLNRGCVVGYGMVQLDIMISEGTGYEYEATYHCNVSLIVQSEPCAGLLRM